MSSSTFVADYSEEEIKKAHEVLYNEGLRMRIKVAGKDYVEKSLSANKDAFSKPMQEVHFSKPPSLPNRLLTESSSLQRPAGAGYGLGPA